MATSILSLPNRQGIIRGDYGIYVIPASGIVTVDSRDVPVLLAAGATFIGQVSTGVIASLKGCVSNRVGDQPMNMSIPLTQPYVVETLYILNASVLPQNNGNLAIYNQPNRGGSSIVSLGPSLVNPTDLNNTQAIPTSYQVGQLYANMTPSGLPGTFDVLVVGQPLIY